MRPDRGPGGKRVLGGALVLWGGVTLVDIVVVHWGLGRHRLYHGEHVTAAEAALAGLGALALVRGMAALRLDRSPGARR